MEKRIKNKIIEYCNYKKSKNTKFSLYSIHKEFQKEFWNLCAAIHGEWIRDNSNLKTKELSEQDW
jgi:hypothetical protein